MGAKMAATQKILEKNGMPLYTHLLMPDEVNIYIKESKSDLDFDTYLW